jgi:hypothetical protein
MDRDIQKIFDLVREKVNERRPSGCKYSTVKVSVKGGSSKLVDYKHNEDALRAEYSQKKRAYEKKKSNNKLRADDKPPIPLKKEDFVINAEAGIFSSRGGFFIISAKGARTNNIKAYKYVVREKDIAFPGDANLVNVTIFDKVLYTPENVSYNLYSEYNNPQKRNVVNLTLDIQLTEIEPYLFSEVFRESKELDDVFYIVEPSDEFKKQVKETFYLRFEMPTLIDEVKSCLNTNSYYRRSGDNRKIRTAKTVLKKEQMKTHYCLYYGRKKQLKVNKTAFTRVGWAGWSFSVKARPTDAKLEWVGKITCYLYSFSTYITTALS